MQRKSMTENKINRYNLRVYGLLIHNNQVLITHENRAGMLMTKFPGGGLEMGEGLADCLQREFQEELQIQVDVNDLFYVNEFFQQSRFRDTDQLVSFYYKVETPEIDEIPIQPIEGSLKKGQQVFDWWNIDDLKEDDFTFPIDKIVSQLLKSQS